MKETVRAKFRKYVLDCLRLDGGETGWTRIRQDEWPNCTGWLRMV